VQIVIHPDCSEDGVNPGLLPFSVQPRAAVARAMNSKRWSGYRFFVEEFFSRESWMEFGGVG